MSLFAAAIALAAPFLVRAEAPRRLDLPQLIARAKTHARVRAEEHGAAAARARVGEARGALFPKLEVNAFLGPSPEINCANPECTITSPDEATVAFDGVFGGVRANLAQPLFTFGKISGAISAARNAAEAAELDGAAARGEMVHRAAQAYYGLKLARELTLMLEEGKQEIDKAFRNVEAQLKKGSSDITVQDRLRMETLRAEIEARLTEAYDGQAAALAGVRAIAGDPTADIDEAPLEPVTFTLEKSAEVYVTRARAQRPELRGGRLKVESVQALADVERARWWPDLLLLGGVNFARAQGVDDPPSAFANDPFNATSATVGLVLRWTIDPASQIARVERAEEQAKQADALLAAGVAAADLEVRRSHSQAQQAAARLEATERGEKAARGWVASVLQGEMVGVSEPKDLADAYIAYFTMRSRVLQSIYDWNLAVMALRRALGEFGQE